MRVLQIGSDRSKRGILFPGSPAFRRQQAYAEKFGHLDIIGFSLRSDGAVPTQSQTLRVMPTDSSSKLLFGLDALRIARDFQKPDVVSAQDPFETGFVAWLIARRFGAPLHLQVHTDFLSPAYARLSLGNRLRPLCAGFTLARASRIRVVSNTIKERIEARYNPRAEITVVPIFADIERLRALAQDSALTARFITFGWRLLVVSRLEPEKNVGGAIRALAQAAPPDACLIIVGSGSERSALQTLAERLGVGRRVFFEGEHAAPPYYKLADLALAPSLYEGYGLVIVEALAAGKPVLSNDVGVAREAGALVASPETFALGLRKWFESGPRTGELKRYPYKDFDEYVRAYCDDMRAVV